MPANGHLVCAGRGVPQAVADLQDLACRHVEVIGPILWNEAA